MRVCPARSGVQYQAIMRRILASALVALVVHMQVAAAVCLCGDESEGHHHDHAVGIAAGDDGDDDACDFGAGQAVHPATPHPSNSRHGDHPAGGCECSPEQLYAPHDPAELVNSSRPIGPSSGFDLPPLWVRATLAHVDASFALRARPPPLIRGVSSMSPMSLSKLQY